MDFSSSSSSLSSTLPLSPYKLATSNHRCMSALYTFIQWVPVSRYVHELCLLGEQQTKWERFACDSRLTMLPSTTTLSSPIVDKIISRARWAEGSKQRIFAMPTTITIAWSECEYKCGVVSTERRQGNVASEQVTFKVWNMFDFIIVHYKCRRHQSLICTLANCHALHFILCVVYIFPHLLIRQRQAAFTNHFKK